MSVCPIIGDVKLDHLTKVVIPTRFLCNKAMFPLYDTFETVYSAVQ